MKKKIFGVWAAFLFSSASVFGYYSAEGFIAFLVHSNQLRIRTDRLGVLAGSRNIRFAVGVTGSQNMGGIILNNLGSDSSLSDSKNGIDKFVPAALVGFGYKNDKFGIGAAYEYKFNSPTYMVHTPVITATANNDKFRINVPVSIGVGSKSKKNDGKDLSGTMVLSTAIEARYYFNTPIFGHIRAYVNYGNSKIKEVNDKSINFIQQSVGGQLRAYFKVETPNVLIEPIIRVQFDKSLRTTHNNVSGASKIVDNFSITAKGFIPEDGGGTGAVVGAGGANANLNKGTLQGGYIASIPSGYYAKEPYRLGVALPVGFNAKSEDENIRFYLEPAISFTAVGAKNVYVSGTESLPEKNRTRRKGVFYTFGYVVYGELYLKPVPQLEWYTEIQTGGATVAGNLASANSTSLVFNAATGITWFF